MIVVLCCLLVLHGVGITASSLDLSLNQFTDKGELRQLSFAARAVERSLPAHIAFIHQNNPRPSFKQGDNWTASNDTSSCGPTDGTTAGIGSCVCILSFSGRPSPLERRPSSNIERVDEGIVGAITGYDPDCRQLRSQLNLMSQSHRLTFGNEAPSLDAYGSKLSRWLSRAMHATMGGGDEEEDDEDGDSASRIYAASCILAAYDKSEQRCRIMNILNTGSYEDVPLSLMGNFNSISDRYEAIERIVVTNEYSLEEKIRQVIAVIEDKEGLKDRSIELECCIVHEQGIELSGLCQDVSNIHHFIATRVAALNELSIKQ
jgi:20S proteasome alpha/beta subunit